ncbi:HEPN domain-containing protein, partial [Rhizobium sp. CF142]|uniref:HEPN domain-containing protein n=1 Tax=Rhizobium sp. CF142 TaxID=1144314 RepID=UPI00026F0461
GKILFEEDGHPLKQPKPLTTEEAKAEAQRHFEQWLPDAIALQEGALFYSNGGHANLAAFTLHQATERLYHCLLLTLTLYSPKSHRVKVLRSRAEELDKRLIAVWPRDNRIARRRFELLSRAYVEARYSPNFEISIQELGWLTERVKVLQSLVEAVCRERLG